MSKFPAQNSFAHARAEGSCFGAVSQYFSLSGQAVSPRAAAIDLESAAFMFHMGVQDLENHQVVASRVFSDPLN
jgi:hypothetical protein